MDNKNIMSAAPKSHYTLQEYFAMDDASDVKLEYYNGQIYAMAGALEPHNLIAVNATASLVQQLRGSPCRVYSSDQRLVTGDGLYTYPDLSVACDPKFAEASRRTLLNPVLIVEVLSESTETYDRTGKFKSYWSIQSFQEYVLISSTRMEADLYTRQPGGRWLMSSANKPEDTIELVSCGCKLKLADLYEKVEFPPLAGIAGRSTE
jgi:Uma2 family endonuclease